MRIDVSFDHRDVDAELAVLHARMQAQPGTLHAMAAHAAVVPGLVFRWREVHGEFQVFVEDAARGVLAGCTLFQRVPGLDRRAGRALRTPHSRYATAYRGQGLARTVYRWALDAGLSLLSGPRQSPAAHRLWLSLARTHELAFVQVREGFLCPLEDGGSAPRRDDLATRMLLPGAGCALADFAAPAGDATLVHRGCGKLASIGIPAHRACCSNTNPP